MSTVVVVRKGESCVIAADSLTTYGSTKLSSSYNRNRSKILKMKENYIGIVGSSAHNNVLRHILKNYPDVISLKGIEEIFDSYLKLHPILKEKYFVNTNEGKDEQTEYESSQIEALVANQHGIFGMFSWREVFEYERFWAIGSGREFALGAMFAVYDRLPSAEEIAIAGVSAGAEFDDSSALPYTIHSVKLKKHHE
ncbi:MAG: MFS transporter [Blastocatellia bacterium]|nr:MFS transporter [Blastocatellia bacterium]